MGDGYEKGKELGHSSSSHSASASANAEARMKYASVDALSELVWSPRHGLSIRCADFSFTRKTKLLSPNFFDIGQPMEVHPSSTSVQEEAGLPVNFQLSRRDRVMDRTEDDLNQGRSRSNEMNRPLSGIGGPSKDLKPEREERVEEKVEINDDIESKEAETRAGTSKRSLVSPRAIGGKAKKLLANEHLRLGSTGSQEEQINHGDKEEEEKTDTKVLYGDHVESTDENDLTTRAVAASKAPVVCESKRECLPEDETDVEKAGPSAKAKGKEKAFFDGRRNEDKDNESFGSVESCNSAGLGKKRRSFEQQLILGSKRIKTLGQECLESGSKLKQDSSFMIWISNMTKGIWKEHEENNSPTVALTTNLDANDQLNAENIGCRNTGFQSFFQSIYCPKKRSQDAEEMDFPNDANTASKLELPSLPDQRLITQGGHLSSSDNEIGPVAETNITSGKVGYNQPNETFSPVSKHEDKEPNISFSLLSKSKPNEEQKARGEADAKITHCLTNKNSGLESLWISRFASKSSSPKKKNLHKRITNEAATEANGSASDVAKPRDSQKMLTKNNVMLSSVRQLDRFDTRRTIPPMDSSLRIESSEAMASTFAKRLGALKHFIPSGSLAENLEKEQKDVVCFYCGKKGHPLRDCLEVTDIELRDLVQNLSRLSGREEGSSLCIRCFQLTHWAATCPNAPQHSPGAEDRAMKHAVASTSGTKLPVSNFTDVQKAAFDAVKLLRLTRTDVLKWMNNKKKSGPGLEGFYLRLRLGKWEEGSGGTGYHVARIDGGKEGQSSRTQTGNSSISVKVGGMTCFVESQFISNQDFLEEELKAWWRSTGKIGGDGIPLEEELSRKIQQRKMLGL